LNNRELYEQIFGSFENDLTTLNVLDRLEFLFSADESCEREIEFCSFHFYELDSTAIFSMGFEIVSSIISNSLIRLKDEESLYELIVSHQSHDSRFFSLFAHIRFEYLSSDSMRSFIQTMTESFDFLTFPIWCSLCHRLSLSVSINSSCDRFIHQNSSVICPFSPPSNLDGIISYLTKRFGGHVMDRSIVWITASGSYSSESYPLRQIADFENRSVFATKNWVNSWICYDFKDMWIKLTHYSIRSRCDSDSHHLRFWILEGSNDGSDWIEIDERKNDTSLNGRGAISTFSVSKESEREFRMIRLRQTGKNSNDFDYLEVSGMEFFGVIAGLNQ
jgi:hypothetical protein